MFNISLPNGNKSVRLREKHFGTFCQTDKCLYIKDIKTEFWNRNREKIDILYSRNTVSVVADHKGVSGNIKLSQILVYWCISKIQELS